MNKLILVTILFLSFSTFFACNTKEDKVPQTATTGELKVAVDEGFWPIMKQEETIFEYIYKYAAVNQLRTDQENAIRLLLADSVRFAVTARELTKNELSYLKSIKVYPKTYFFARDGLVILTNRQSNDSLFTLTQLKEIALGSKKNAQLIVEKGHSSGLFSFVELLGLKNSKLSGVYGLDSVQAIIQHVSTHPNSIGVVGSSWLSEQESQRVQTWLEKVRISSVSSNGKDFYQPFQSEIADSLYPLARPIYLISRESQMSLANGYAAFLLGEKGQRILLKAGLLPAKIPSREVVVSKKSVY